MGTLASPKVIVDLARCSDLRGLECRMIKPIYLDRVKRRNNLRKAIIQLQKIMKDEGSTIQDSSDALAEVAELLAVPGKAFARTMGQVDAISVKKQTKKKQFRRRTFAARDTTHISLQSDQFRNNFNIGLKV